MTHDGNGTKFKFDAQIIDFFLIFESGDLDGPWYGFDCSTSRGNGRIAVTQNRNCFGSG